MSLSIGWAWIQLIATWNAIATARERLEVQAVIVRCHRTKSKTWSQALSKKDTKARMIATSSQKTTQNQCVATDAWIWLCIIETIICKTHRRANGKSKQKSSGLPIPAYNKHSTLTKWQSVHAVQANACWTCAETRNAVAPTDGSSFKPLWPTRLGQQPALFCNVYRFYRTWWLRGFRSSLFPSTFDIFVTFLCLFVSLDGGGHPPQWLRNTL